MPSIYEILFNHMEGVQEQVNCCFHDDQNASAGISPEGAYHCFTCGHDVDASSEEGFIKNYFDVSLAKAKKMKDNLESVDKYKVIENPLTNEQKLFLQSIGLTLPIIEKYFICSASGKLMYKHTWNDYTIGYTWFNNEHLSNYNAGSKKYRYQNIMAGGMCTPYNDVINYNQLIITEGEKDMLTVKSMGFPNAVAKIGGAETDLICGRNFNNKQVVIIYDCDDQGREGAIKDANNLVNNYACKVKVIDLGLNDKEDLNDYFMKYNKTKNDLLNLIAQTPLHVPTITQKESKVDKILKSLTKSEIDELKNKLQGGN